MHARMPAGRGGGRVRRGAITLLRRIAVADRPAQRSFPARCQAWPARSLGAHDVRAYLWRVSARRMSGGGCGRRDEPAVGIVSTAATVYQKKILQSGRLHWPDPTDIAPFYGKHLDDPPKMSAEARRETSRHGRRSPLRLQAESQRTTDDRTSAHHPRSDDH